MKYYLASIDETNGEYEYEHVVLLKSEKKTAGQMI